MTNSTTGKVLNWFHFNDETFTSLGFHLCHSYKCSADPKLGTPEETGAKQYKHSDKMVSESLLLHAYGLGRNTYSTKGYSRDIFSLGYQL